MKKILLLTMFVVLAGCKPASISDTPVATSPENRPVDVSSPTVDSTQIESSQSLSVEDCNSTNIEDINSNSLSGRLIIESDSPHVSYFYDLDTKKQLPVDDQGDTSNIVVSPDANWIAYIRAGDDAGSDMFVVKSTDTVTTYEYSVHSEEWQSISHWLDNEKVVLWNHNAPLDNVVIFNPFTKSEEIMSTDFPNILPTDDDWDSYWPSITIYHPELTKLFYIAKQGNTFKPGYSKLVLWNLSDNKSIAEISDFGYSIPYPMWVDNGEKALFVKSVEGYDPPVAHDEIYVTDLDGQVKQITSMADIFDYARILNYSVSPDGKFLAMVVDAAATEAEKPTLQLLLLDMIDLRVKSLCISPEMFSPLIWSPESDKLAISASAPNEGYKTILIDTAQGTVIGALDGFRPRGWLH